jgi:hypothetical protein
MRQFFFHRGQLLGDAVRQVSWVGGTPTPPVGTALFCPLCSEVWFLAPIEGEATRVECRPCERHDAGARLGKSSLGAVSRLEPVGSVWRSWDSEWNEALPREVLKRELLLTINHYERSYHESESVFKT